MTATPHFNLTQEQVMFRDMSRGFASRYIKPVAADNDRSQHFPREIIDQMASLGLLGSIVPRPYGGLGLDYICHAVIVEEIACACQSVAISAFCAHSVVEEAVADWGNEAQKQGYLPSMCKGEILACYALAEPPAGKDIADMGISATPGREGWVISGSKSFVINGGVAQLALVFAHSDREQQGISAFLADRGAPGFSSRDLQGKVGLRACNTADLIFQDCLLPEESLLGKPDDGFSIFSSTLDNACFNFAASYVGLAQACINVSIKYAQERQAFGRSISEFQAIQQLIADMLIETQAARLLVYQVGGLKNRGLAFTKEVSMAKCYASEAAMRAANSAFQVHGGYGYLKEFPVERYLRDAATATLYQGTPSMLKLRVAECALSFS